MARTDQTFPLRIPAPLRKAVEKSSKINRRSLTAEILLLLEQGMQAADLSNPHTAPRVEPNDPRTHVAMESLRPYYLEGRETDERLNNAIRRLPEEKKRALLTLLEGGDDVSG